MILKPLRQSSFCYHSKGQKFKVRESFESKSEMGPKEKLPAPARQSAVTIASSLMGGCGLSHERVEDGCKSTCVEFGG